jgi:hypothetical protein
MVLNDGPVSRKGSRQGGVTLISSEAEFVDVSQGQEVLYLRALIKGFAYLHHGKDTGSYMTAVKDAIAAMVASIPEITIKDETNEFDDKEFKKEYKKIYRDAEDATTQKTQPDATILTKSAQ